MDELDRDTAAALWAASGAAGLSGRAGADPLPVPLAVVENTLGLGAAITERSERLGRRVDLDCLALLGERAAIAGLHRNGDTSCGGATQLLRSADAHVAVSLARESDIELVPAWMEAGPGPSDPSDVWQWIAELARDRTAATLVERARLLGIPCSALGEVSPGTLWSVARLDAGSPPAAVSSKPVEEMVVVDLSSLWAGPLCAHVLALAGMRVIKVESTTRPDGARLGPASFYDLLHGGHESVALDFADLADIDALRRLIAKADVVIEGSRPRALAQLGIDAAAADGPTVWVSITGHGRTGVAADRVGFGDDTAVAGGLVTWDDDGPCFLADAVADPLTGLLTASHALFHIRRGGRWLIDIPLAHVAAWCSPGPLLALDIGAIAEPLHRPVTASAAPLGRDTESVLADFRIER